MVKRRSWVPASAGLSVVLFLLACASAGGGSGSARSNEVITQEEIESVDVATTYELVQRLRPGWLRGRGPVSLSGGEGLPVVYVDEVRSGSIDVLEDVPAGIVRRITFLSGRDASVQYGLDHGSGAIMVETGG